MIKHTIWRHLVLFLCLSLSSLSCKKKESNTIDVQFETIPGSQFHSPNGTWWGYNQQKIVRFNSRVFMAVIENDNLVNGFPNALNPSIAYIYTKTDQGSWLKGAGLPTSRPVNLLMDSEGILHVIVFEPTEVDPTENGSLGKLKHYWFPNAANGDIQTHLEEVVEDHSPGNPETVNIRIGAAIGANDMMYITFGINQDVKIYDKQVGDLTWNEELAGQNLGNSYYYPYLTSTSSGPCILAVQDDYVGPGLPAIYFKNKIFQKFNGSWSNQTLIDLSNHPLTLSRNRLVDNCELFTTSNNKVLAIYQTYLDPNIDWKASHTQIEIDQSGQITTTPLTLDSDEINRIRIIEYEGQIYYLCIRYDKLFIKKGIDGKLTEINTPPFVSGNYIYLSSPMNSANLNSNYIDILMLNGNSMDYPSGTNYYVRLSKCQLNKL